MQPAEYYRSDPALREFPTSRIVSDLTKKQADDEFKAYETHLEECQTLSIQWKEVPTLIAAGTPLKSLVQVSVVNGARLSESRFRLFGCSKDEQEKRDYTIPVVISYRLVPRAFEPFVTAPLVGSGVYFSGANLPTINDAGKYKIQAEVDSKTLTSKAWYSSLAPIERNRFKEFARLKLTSPDVIVLPNMECLECVFKDENHVAAASPRKPPDDIPVQFHDKFKNKLDDSSGNPSFA